MALGLDTDVRTTSHLPCIVAAGYKWIGRYIKPNRPKKQLSWEEAKAISDAGLYCVTLFENGFPTNYSYFTGNQGIHDGLLAYHHMKETLKQPLHTPCYFAIDYDASISEIQNNISKYIRGIHQAFNTASGNAPAYFVGVYGSGNTCSILKTSKLTAYTWLSLSQGWGGTKTYTDYNIKQLKETTICSIDSDTNISAPKGGGGWKI